MAEFLYCLTSLGKQILGVDYSSARTFGLGLKAVALAMNVIFAKFVKKSK